MDTMQGEEKSILLHNCTVIGMDLDFSEHPGKDVLLKHGYISAITDSTTSLATSEGNMVWPSARESRSSFCKTDERIGCDAYRVVALLGLNVASCAAEVRLLWSLCGARAV